MLQLAPESRRPFVLRILAGLSRETSAAMLNLSAGQLDERICKAIETLAFGKEKSKMEENNTTQQDIEQLAYRLWQERGEPMGSPEEDWLKAEEELRAVAAQA